MASTVGPRTWLDETAAALGLQTVAPLLDDADQQQRQLQQPAPSQPSFASMVPSLDALLGGPTASPPSPQPSTTPAAGGGSFLSGLPSLNDLLGGLGLGQQQQVAPTPSGTPQAMPTTPGSGIPGPDQTEQGVPVRSVGEMAPEIAAARSATPTAQKGEIDNSSRASFARTAWPYALEAAGGDRELAKRLIASAISENGTVGAGGPIGVGFNFGGIKHDPDAVGSGQYATWESEGGRRVDQTAGFAHYASPQEGFNAIPRFLQRNFPKQWATYQQTGDAARLYREINAGGYATDQNWSNVIESIAANQVAPAVDSLPAQTAQQQSRPPAAPAAPDGAPGRVLALQTPNLGGPRRATRGIVVHSTRGRGETPEDEFEKTLAWFANPASQVSAHAVIAADGTVAMVGDWDAQTWHAGENNADRLGIELVQSAADNDRGVPFTDAQYRSLAWLTAQMARRYGFGIDRNALVGHEELEQGHRQGKTDPGKSFDWDRYQQEAAAAAAGGSGDVMRAPLNADAAFPSPASATPQPPAAPSVAAGGSPLDDARAQAWSDQPLMQRNSLDPSAEAQADTYAPPPPVVPQGMMSPDPTDIRELQQPQVTITQGGPPNGPSVPLYSPEIPGPDLSPQGTPIVSRPMAPSWTYDESPSAGLPEQGQVPPPSPYAPGQAESMEPLPTRFNPPPPPTVTAFPGEPDQPPAVQPTTQTGRALKPVWDAAGAVVGYVQEAAGKVEEARGNISSTLMDFGIGPAGMLPQRVLPRIEQIEEQAAREVGHDTSTTQGRLTRWRAAQDPGWRARNPALAEEYDRLQMELGLQVVGQAGDAARIGRLGQAAEAAPFRARPGNIPEELTPSIVPPEVARSLGGPVRVPDDPGFVQAVENTRWATLTDDGLEIDLRRMQRPESAGQETPREGVFYSPRAASRKEYADPSNSASTGGSQRIEGPTVIRSPYVVDSTSSLVGPRALDDMFGEGTFQALYRDIAAIHNGPPSRSVWHPGKTEELRALLEQRGITPEQFQALRSTYRHDPGEQAVAVADTLAARALREEGHDAIVAYGKTGRKPAQITEIFDLREATYPTPEGGYTLRPEFQPGRPAQEAAEAGATIGRGGATPITIRPQGWEAASDDVATITRPGHYYRGMTEDEFNVTLGAGSGVRSRADYSVAREGTSFSHQAQDAESYANFGRDDPRKTGRPTYLVEIAGDEGLRLDRDGYWKAEGEIPPDRITRIIRMEANDGAVVGTDIPVPQPRPPTNAERVAAADARMREQGSTSTLGTVGVAPSAPARAAEPAPVFYSQLRRTIEEKMPNRAGPAQIQGILKGSAVKPDEITWTGLDDWLAEQRGPVTKQQVLDFLDQNEVRVEEVIKGDPLIRWRQDGDALVAAEAPTLRVVQAPDGTFRVEHDGRLSPIPFRTVDEAKAAAQDIATDPAVGLVPQPTSTRYGQYTLPGGDNYRELLLTLPERQIPGARYAIKGADGINRPSQATTRAAAIQEAGGDARRVVELVDRQAQDANPNYRSAHWDEPNVLAHVRFNERTAPDGKRVLMIEEVQSDWHQAGRRQGYAGKRLSADERAALVRERDTLARDALAQGYTVDTMPAAMRARWDDYYRRIEADVDGPIPDAPFKKTWPELAIKRMVRWAAENDFDRIAWSPGAVHAERYSLGNQIDELRWFKSSDPYARGNVRLQGYKGGQQVVDRAASPDELPGLVGQEVARKITGAAETAQNGVLRGTDLQVGGQGMTGFYDEILPATAQKLGKRFGARVGRSEIDAGTGLGRNLSLSQDADGYWWFGRNGQREQGPFRERAWAEQGMADEIERHPAQRQPVHSLDITPAMRESVLSVGQPLFVTPGTSAGVRGAGALTQLSTDLGNTLSGAAVGATTGAMVPVEATDTNDPMAERLRNMGAGALIGAGAFPALGRLQRRGGGALATLGAGAGRAFDAPNRPPNLGDIPPSQIQEPTLPGMEPPNVRQAIPDVSDVPNRPPVLGDVPPSAIREPMLPGMEPPPARPLGEVADELLGASAERAPIPRIRGEGGQLHLPTAPAAPGLVTRISEALEPFGRRVDIVRYAGMLSDTALHAMNATTNVMLQVVDLATTPVAAALDAGRVAASRAAGRPAQREVFFGEIPARLRGMWDGTVPVTQAGNRVGAKAGLEAAWQVLRTGLRPEDLAKLDRQTSGFASGNAVIDFAVEYPLRTLGAADALFRSIAKGGHAAAEGYAAARKAAGGAKPTPEQVREALKNPELLEKIDQLAARSVLQENRLLTDWYRWAMNYQPKTEAGKLAAAPAKAVASVVIPFVRTPYNIVAQGVGMTPAGYLGLVQDIAEGKAPREMAYRAARATIGTAVMAEAATAYANGDLTGPYPEDAKTRSTLPPGWQPWSRKVTLPDGSVRYIPLSYLGPLAVPSVAMILAAETAKQGKAALSPEWAGAVALGIGRYAEQNTFFEGLATVSKAFDERSGEANLERTVEQIASQFSPHVIGGGALGREIQRIMDMPLRNPEGALEALLATHPLTAGQVPARQDVLGRELRTSPGGAEAAVVRSTVERDAGVIRAFRKAGEGLPTSPPKQARDPATGEARTLSRSQQQRWRRAFGQALREEWDNSGNPTDTETLRGIESRAREMAVESVFGMR